MVHCIGDMQGQQRIRKLIERKDHIESEIEILQDRRFIIESEIAAETRERIKIPHNLY